jgi:hypothetical protein
VVIDFLFLKWKSGLLMNLRHFITHDTIPVLIEIAPANSNNSMNPISRADIRKGIGKKYKSLDDIREVSE